MVARHERALVERASHNHPEVPSGVTIPWRFAAHEICRPARSEFPLRHNGSRDWAAPTILSKSAAFADRRDCERLALRRPTRRAAPDAEPPETNECACENPRGTRRCQPIGSCGFVRSPQPQSRPGRCGRSARGRKRFHAIAKASSTRISGSDTGQSNRIENRLTIDQYHVAADVEPRSFFS